MGRVHKLQNIQIGHDPKGVIMGLDTAGRRYAWPTEKMPGIIAALRACARGEPMPDGCNGMVFAAGGGDVALADEPPKTTLQNVRGEAAMVIEAKTYSYVMTKRAALELADGFEEVHRKLTAPKRS